MTYITHRPFNGIAASGRKMEIPYGSEFSVIANWIATPQGEAICSIHSENAKRCFAVNDDGCGLERGALTWAIAYEPRQGQKGFRFSDSEIELLEKDYGRWLRDTEFILFNDDFFAASVPELQKLADALNIKPRSV